jgi:hypothetical protein
MRPQLAMAALLLLMIGASLLFLRGRPGARDSVLVTEHGMPENEAEHVAVRPAPAAAAAPELAASAQPRAAAAKGEVLAQRDRESDKAADGLAEPSDGRLSEEAQKGSGADSEAPAAAEAGESMEAASLAFQSGRYVEAQRRFEEIAARGGADAPRAALQAVEALRRLRGCPAAAPRYEEVHTRYRDTPSGNEAAWQAGDCYRALGDLPLARRNLEPLLQVAEYRARTEAALQELTAREEQLASAKKAKASAPPAAAAPAPANEAKPGKAQGE